MSFLPFLRRYYGKFNLGKPFGVNLRQLAEDADLILSQLTTPFRRFRYRQTQLHYVSHQYNQTWLNERTLEVPIGLYHLKHANPDAVLELGNVLSHYLPVSHDIVDKYEQGRGVQNIDVGDYRPRKHYDLILSLSTLEHVGQDETPPEPAKAVAAIAHLQSLLKSNGKIICTIPAGYNQDLLAYIKKYAKDKPENVLFYQRVSANNHWALTDAATYFNLNFNKPYPFANGVAVVTFFKPPSKDPHKTPVSAINMTNIYQGIKDTF